MDESKLIIVESPSKIGLIEKYLGEKYQVLATRGHICDIGGMKDINVRNNFETTYSIIESKRKNIENMRKTIKQYKHENIYIGTDNDVEGEKIAYDVCNVFSLSLENTHRIRFNEITEIALKISIKNPTHVNMNIVRSQQTRQILDILIGYKISPLLWKYINHVKSESFSAGRCQSSALALIYDNRESLKSKIITKSYKTTGNFLSYPFTIGCLLSKDFDNANAVREFLALSKLFEHTISVGDKYESFKSPPQPLNTSGMIQMGSNLLKITPKMTMTLAQQLYQDGRITYIRTESKKYSSDFLKKVLSFFVSGKFDASLMGEPEKISNLDSSLPHEAIRVTDLTVESIEGDTKLKKLYKEIYKNTIVSCMAVAKYNSYDVKISAPQNLEYVKRIDVPVFKGWTEYYDDPVCDKDVIQYVEYLKSKIVYYQSISSDFNISSNHFHYNETSLIKKLEELGIGRPSTYTSFIEKNLERGFIKKSNIDGLTENCVNFNLESNVLTESNTKKTFCMEKEKLVINETGTLCTEFLRKNFSSIFDYSYTRIMEEKLDELKDNSCDWSIICNETNIIIDRLSKLIRKTNLVIDDSHTLKFTKFGPCVKHILDDGHEYLPVKKGFKMGELVTNASDILEFQTSFLGNYNESPLYIKVGKFGPYLQHNSKNYKIRNRKDELNDITLEIAIEIIESSDNKETIDVSKKSILRYIDNDTSVRQGKYGPYIFHKTKSMTKPHFTNLHDVDILTCDKQKIIQAVKN